MFSFLFVILSVRGEHTNSMKRRKIKILLFLLIFGFLVLNGVSFMHAYRFTHFVSAGERTDRPEELSLLHKIKILLTGVSLPKTTNWKNPEDYGHEYQNMMLVGPDELKTPVWEITSPGASQDTIILFHGYSSNKTALLPLADFLVTQNFNVVLVDLPGHGDSPYSWTTLGYRESDAVKTVFEHYKKQRDTNIVLFGNSLGASSILTAIARHHIEPDGLIVEMPYGSLLDTIKARFKLMGFPISFPFAELLVLWGSVQCGYNAFRLNPVEFAKDVTSPILIIGGEQDQRVPPHILRNIYTNVQGEKELVFFPNIGHQDIFKDAKEEYQDILQHFIKNFVIE